MTFLKYIFRFRIARLIVLAPIIVLVILSLDYFMGPEAVQILGILLNLLAIATWLIPIALIILFAFAIFSVIKKDRKSKREK